MVSDAARVVAAPPVRGPIGSRVQVRPPSSPSSRRKTLSPSGPARRSSTTFQAEKRNSRTERTPVSPSSALFANSSNRDSATTKTAASSSPEDRPWSVSMRANTPEGSSLGFPKWRTPVRGVGIPPVSPLADSAAAAGSSPPASSSGAISKRAVSRGAAKPKGSGASAPGSAAAGSRRARPIMRASRTFDASWEAS